MFLMLIQCPLVKTNIKQKLQSKWNLDSNTETYLPQELQDYTPVSLSWINFYETLLKKSSSHSILKELFRLSKVSNRRENEILAVGSLGEKTAMKVPGILLQMFANKTNLQYWKIGATINSRQDLKHFTRKLPLESLKNESELCINQEDCLQSVGEI